MPSGPNPDFAALTSGVWVSMPTRIRSISMFKILQAQLYDWSWDGQFLLFLYFVRIAKREKGDKD